MLAERLALIRQDVQGGKYRVAQLKLQQLVPEKGHEGSEVEICCLKAACLRGQDKAGLAISTLHAGMSQSPHNLKLNIAMIDTLLELQKYKECHNMILNGMKYGPYPEFEKGLLPYLLKLHRTSPQMPDEEILCIQRRHHKFCAGCNCFFPPGGQPKCCGRCKEVQYCGADCQKKDWRDHKQHCKALQVFHNNTASEERSPCSATFPRCAKVADDNKGKVDDVSTQLTSFSDFWQVKGVTIGSVLPHIQCILAEALSFPLTLVSALSKDYPALMAQPSVSVHVVGAETICEGDPLHVQAWDELQAILTTKLNVTFVGPACEKVPGSRKSQVVRKMVCLTYHDYMTSSQGYTKPDVIIMYHPGFPRYKEWFPSIAAMAGVPCIATGFRQSDMNDIKKWIELIENVVPIQFKVHSSGESPLRSLRPIRQERPNAGPCVIYKNWQYITFTVRLSTDYAGICQTYSQVLESYDK